MKFHLSKNQLVESLNIAIKGTSSRSTLPILSGIYIKASDGKVTFQTTDLEISVQNSVEALIEENGETVVSAKLFFEIVKSLPDSAIYCSLIDSQFVIKSLDSTFSINTMDSNDYPSFPELKDVPLFSLVTDNLSSLVRKVHKAVSKDESRVVLGGILLNINDSQLSLVATDSYRLSIVKTIIENENDVSVEMIVPGNVFEEVTKLLKGEDSLKIGATDSQIIFVFGNSKFVTRKIEGNYPNYKQIIPAEKTTTAIVNTKGFIDSVKRASLLTRDFSQIKIELDKNNQEISISSKVNDVGNADETIEAQIDGEDLVIGFNPQYLLDGLTSVESEEVMFEAQSSLKPGVLKSTGEEDFFYLTMPVRVDN